MAIIDFNRVVEILEESHEFFEGREFKLDPEHFEDWGAFRRAQEAKARQKMAGGESQEGAPPASTLQRERR